MLSFLKNFFNELYQFRKFLKLNEKQKEIIFYAENESQLDFFEDIINSLLKKNIPITYITSSPTDRRLKIKGKINFFYIGSKTIRTIFFSTLNTKVLIMSLPDLNKYEIRRSKYPVKYIFVPHNILSTHMVFRKGAFDAFDIFFLFRPASFKRN